MTSGLIERANRLEKLAKAATEGEGDSLTIERLRTALGKLRASLPVLAAALAMRQAIDEVDPTTAKQLAFADAHADLDKFVATRGRPTAQRVDAAVTRMQQQVKDLESETLERWHSWTVSQLALVPKVKVAALPPNDRPATEALLKSLEADANRQPNPALMASFRSRVRLVRDDLEGVTLEGAVLEVLERFSTPAGVLLSHLTDEEIALLRANPALAEQFVIRRQG